MRRACFVVNPIAGVGGPYGLKGSDDVEAVRKLVVEKRAVLGAPARAIRFLRALKEKEVVFLTASGLMGEQELEEVGLEYEVVYEAPEWTSAHDTRETVRRALARGAELIVFVGGDGTARDVVTVSGDTPLLGVPAGVKVYSGVFGVTPEAAAEVFDAWVRGEASLSEAEILDIDEAAFRRDRLEVRLYAVARTPKLPGRIQPSKGVLTELGEEDNKLAIARYVAEEKIEHGVLYVLGPGTTVKALADELNVEKTTLGVDLYADGKLLAKDVDEETILLYMDRYPRTVVIVSPLGKQGFILGRGNQQISPRILKRISKRDLLVLATKAKLKETPVLRVDTGDPEIDAKFRGYIRVVVDYREERVVKVI